MNIGIHVELNQYDFYEVMRFMEEYLINFGIKYEIFGSGDRLRFNTTAPHSLLMLSKPNFIMFSGYNGVNIYIVAGNEDHGNYLEIIFENISDNPQYVFSDRRIMGKGMYFNFKILINPQIPESVNLKEMKSLTIELSSNIPQCNGFSRS